MTEVPAAAACPPDAAIPWITMKGTMKTVDSSRMVCIKVTTVRSVSAISSLKTTICVSPPGTLPIMPLDRLTPVRRQTMYPTARLNIIVEEVANTMAGSCLMICCTVPAENDAPSIKPRIIKPELRSSTGQNKSLLTARLHTMTDVKDPSSHGRGRCDRRKISPPAKEINRVSKNRSNIKLPFTLV